MAEKSLLIYGIPVIRSSRVLSPYLSLLGGSVGAEMQCGGSHFQTFLPRQTILIVNDASLVGAAAAATAVHRQAARQLFLEGTCARECLVFGVRGGTTGGGARIVHSSRCEKAILMPQNCSCFRGSGVSTWFNKNYYPKQTKAQDLSKHRNIHQQQMVKTELD